MEKENVPQEKISTYADNRKAVYATDSDGNYTIVASSGWMVEEAVTRQALEELKRQADMARERVLEGICSPLYFHMFNRRMDIATLAASCGLFQWQVKRHFQPKNFKKLSRKKIFLYSEALGISPDELKTLPAPANGI